MDTIESISGSRIHLGMCQIGGVRRDIPKEKQEGNYDESKVYWSDCYDEKEQKLVANLSGYIHDLISIARTGMVP